MSFAQAASVSRPFGSQFADGLRQRRGRGRAKRLCALLARAQRAQVIITENSRGMAIIKADLDSVTAYLRSRLGSCFGLVHRQQRGCGKIPGGHGFLFSALVVAGSTGAMVAEKRKIEMAGVAIGPDNIHTCAGLDVNLYFFGLFSWIEWCRHKKLSVLSLEL